MAERDPSEGGEVIPGSLNPGPDVRAPRHPKTTTDRDESEMGEGHANVNDPGPQVYAPRDEDREEDAGYRDSEKGSG